MVHGGVGEGCGIFAIPLNTDWSRSDESHENEMEEIQVQIKKGDVIKFVKRYFSKIKFIFLYWSVVRIGKGDGAAQL